MINCEIELILTWSKSCAFADMTPENNPPKIVQITDKKFYVPVVTLSTKNGKKLLEQLKPGFKRTVKWNKQRPQMTIQNKKLLLKLFNWSNIY